MSFERANEVIARSRQLSAITAELIQRAEELRSLRELLRSARDGGQRLIALAHRYGQQDVTDASVDAYLLCREIAQVMTEVWPELSPPRGRISAPPRRESSCGAPDTARHAANAMTR